MRCPLCDGSVVNGRCKDCGMPYRNDEILYHLNESRRDHYQHASDKARKIMREQQRPQDTPKRMNGAAIHQKAEETFEICMGMDTFYSCDVTCTGIWRF